MLASLRSAGVIRDARSARYVVASRTDRGVSAWGNVCAVDTGADPRSLVHEVAVPVGLWLLSAVAVDAEFSPRTHASERTYRYHVASRDLDWGKMREAARLFVGLHEFTKFCRHESGVGMKRRIRSVRVQRGTGTRSGWIQFVAPNFLWEQVRRMVHAVLDVGAGGRDVDSIARQLGGDGRPEAPSAPEPLVLEHVAVPVEFPSSSKKLVGRIEVAMLAARATHDFYSGLASSLPTIRR